MITCFDEIISLEANLEKLSYELTPENIENNPGLLDRFDRLQNEVLTHKDYHYKSKIESVLYGLDFTKDVFDKKNHVLFLVEKRLDYQWRNFY